MLDSTRSFVDEHRDISKLVQQAERFSIQLPLVGRVAVPSPKQLAFYGALGALAVFEVIDWPVAVAVGVGHLVTTRTLANRVEAAEAEAQHAEEQVEELLEQVQAARTKPAPTKAAATTPAKKAPAKKAPAKKTTAKKAPAKTAPKAPTQE